MIFSNPSALLAAMLVAAAVTTLTTTNAFITPMHQQHRTNFATVVLQGPTTTTSLLMAAAADDDDDDKGDDEKKENPYADPNYPDLEFVDYSDPEYSVDQGTGDEFSEISSSSRNDDTEAQVEAMREERRVKNDEFQFETYYKEVLKDGQEFKGEWTVFRTSTFSDGETVAGVGRPRLSKAIGPFKVISKGERVDISDGEEIGDNQLEFERILHHEKIFNDPDNKEENETAELIKQKELSMNTKFWPDQLSCLDFRGQQGVMCVGNAYTICAATPLDDSQKPNEGPFASYSAELGITSEDVVRFRVKLDYSVVEDDAKKDMPPLHLKSFTICRETLGMWPRAEKYKSAIEAVTQDALFGPRGAKGGLYDPPPVGSEEQASQYFMLDLEGRATVLLPYLMDQNPDVHGLGWVTSLDWTPGTLRYQLDRKIGFGKDIMGLRTLELSEVQGADADTYRPTDGGENMRQ